MTFKLRSLSILLLLSDDITALKKFLYFFFFFSALHTKLRLLLECKSCYDKLMIISSPIKNENIIFPACSISARIDNENNWKVCEKIFNDTSITLRLDQNSYGAAVHVKANNKRNALCFIFHLTAIIIFVW